jgi:benzoate membrane transport protein
MRSFSLPLPTLFAGFVAVLVGYASSAAIIWQAAARPALPRADRRLDDGPWPRHGHQHPRAERLAKVPVLTAWSTPGAALLVSGLQG